MGKKQNQMPRVPLVQVIELTMDNPEDQDELNRQLRKPGEPNKILPAMIARKLQDASIPEPPEKKSGGGNNSGRTKG